MSRSKSPQTIQQRTKLDNHRRNTVRLNQVKLPQSDKDDSQNSDHEKEEVKNQLAEEMKV